MTKYVSIVGGVIDRVSSNEPTPKEDVEVVQTLLDVTPEWSYVDGVFTPREPTSDEVNSERDRRLLEGFEFLGKSFDFDLKSKTNISGAAQMAFMAIVAGATPGYMRWHGGSDEFSWISKDNSIVAMDAQTTVAFGQTAAQHERRHSLIARALKDTSPIPQDYESDEYWKQ